MNLDYLNVTLSDLAAWYKNYVQRVRIAEALNCHGPLHTNWNCCIAHQGLRNESLYLYQGAAQFQSLDVRAQPLSEAWWTGLGQAEAAMFASGKMV